MSKHSKVLSFCRTYYPPATVSLTRLRTQSETGQQEYISCLIFTVPVNTTVKKFLIRVLGIVSVYILGHMSIGIVFGFYGPKCLPVLKMSTAAV